mmetsp:Transcript_6927/g.17567  ORF Transcript_6927/g.17567 Transcript_6927/m.17567 type:complete len:126 (+) Transcript_6927:4629-5006(+)
MSRERAGTAPSSHSGIFSLCLSLTVVPVSKAAVTVVRPCIVVALFCPPPPLFFWCRHSESTFSSLRKLSVVSYERETEAMKRSSELQRGEERRGEECTAAARFDQLPICPVYLLPAYLLSTRSFE